MYGETHHPLTFSPPLPPPVQQKQHRIYHMITSLFSLSMACVAKSAITPCNGLGGTLGRSRGDTTSTHWRNTLCKDLNLNVLNALVCLMCDLNGLVGAMLVDFPLIVHWAPVSTYCSALGLNRWQNMAKPRSKFSDPAAACLLDYTSRKTKQCRLRDLQEPLKKACANFALHAGNAKTLRQINGVEGGVAAIAAKFKTEGTCVAAPSPTDQSTGIVKVTVSAKTRIILEVSRRGVEAGGGGEKERGLPSMRIRCLPLVLSLHHAWNRASMSNALTFNVRAVSPRCPCPCTCLSVRTSPSAPDPFTTNCVA